MKISEKTDIFQKIIWVFIGLKLFLKKFKNAKISKNRKFPKKFFKIFSKKFIGFYHILKGRIVLKPRKMKISGKTGLF